MARTISQIYDSMILEKTYMPTLKSNLLNEDGSSSISTSQDLLDNLTTTSRTAVWKLIFYTLSVIIHFQEELWDLFKTEIELIKSSAFVGTSLWWEDKILAFQYGDALEVNPLNYSINYPVIDTSKQIINHCAADEINGIIRLKVRRVSTDLLSVDELAALNSYISQIKFAGTRCNVYNLLADDLKLYYTIYYDPIVSITTLQPLVESAINDYIENIPFNGELDINQLNVNIKAITGIKAVIFESGEGKNGAASYIAFDNYYSSNAGYAQIASAFPLSSTITYIKK